MTDEVIPIDPEERARRRELVKQKVRGQPVQRARLESRVLELRAAGLSEEQIGQQTGISQQRVSKIITRNLEKWAKQQGQDVERVRQLRLYELDQLKRAVWADALKGNLKAVREAVRIIQAQAKISGAEAPTQVEHRGTIDLGIDPHEVQRMEQAWLDSSTVVEGDAKELPAGG